MITKTEFITFCDSIIPQEEKDKYTQKTRKMWITLIAVVLLEALITFLVYPYWTPIIYIMPVIAIISTVIIVVTMKYKWGDFKKKYSKQVFDCLLKGYQYKYQPDYCIGQSIFNASGFGGNYDSYSGEDLLTVNIPNDDGSPSKVTLNICDLYVTRTETYTVRVRNSDGSYSTETRTRTVIVYKGVFGYIYFPFEFKCNMSLNIAFKGEKKIKLEDIHFNKVFKTYTDNQLEALLILTPTLMTKLIEFSKRVSGFKLYLSKSGSMYFGMSRNLFKLKSFFKKPSGKVFERYYDDTIDILSMVDEIKNNNKVFKM